MMEMKAGDVCRERCNSTVAATGDARKKEWSDADMREIAIECAGEGVRGVQRTKGK